MTNIYNNIMQNKSLKRVIYVIYKNTKKTFQMSLLYITKKMLVYYSAIYFLVFYRNMQMYY